MRLPWDRPAEVPCPQCDMAAPGDARWCGACGAALVEQGDGAEDEGRGAGPHDDDAARDSASGGRLLAAALVVAVLGGLLAVQATREPPVVPAGFMSRGDGARTGVVSTVDVPPPSGVAWRTPVELPPLLTPGADVLGTTTTGDGRELVVVRDPADAGRRVTAHDADDGEVVSTTMLPLGSRPHDLSLTDGLLAHRDLTAVTLVDLTTGEHRWRVERRLREDTQVTRAGVVGVPAETTGVDLVLLDLTDGSVVWQRTIAPTGQVTAVLDVADTIVVAVEGGLPVLLGLDPATGDEVWRLNGSELPVRETFPQVPLVATGDQVLVSGIGASVLVDARSGDVTPVLPLPAPPGGDPGAPADPVRVVVNAADEELVVVSDGAQRIQAIDVSGGQPRQRWVAAAPAAPVFALEVRAGVVAVRGDAGTVLLDATDGQRLAQVGPAGGSPRLVVTEDGSVVRLTADGDLEMVGAGGVQWRRPTVAVHLPDLATDAGAVAVTTPQGIEVLDVEDGERRFAHEAFDPGLVEAASLSPPVLLAGRVAVAPPEQQPPARGGLLALFADTGIVDWARTSGRVPPRGVAVVDRDLLVMPVGSQLHGFEPASGRRALVIQTGIARADLAAAGGWLVAIDAPGDVGDVWVGRRSSRELVFRAPIRTCAPPVIHDGLVILTDHVGDIIARTLQDGSQPWGERSGGSACRPLSIAGEVLVALVDDRELLGVGLDDGETTWRVELPDIAAGAPVVAGGQVLVPTLAGEVLAYDVDGRDAPDGPAWRVDVGGTPAGAVAVDGSTLLVVTREGEVVALR